MKIKGTELSIVHGNLSSVKADAYVLPFLPHHECPTGVRLEVASAGALGVRHLHYGEVFFLDARGGNANTLIALICRHPRQDVKQQEDAIRKGLVSMFINASKYEVKHVAMPALCCDEGIDEVTFAKILTDVLMGNVEHCVEKISIVSNEKHRVTKLCHIIE